MKESVETLKGLREEMFPLFFFKKILLWVKRECDEDGKKSEVNQTHIKLNKDNFKLFLLENRSNF